MKLLFPAVLALSLAACATPRNNYDPLEPVNRKIYGFNRSVDRAVLSPVTRGYVAHVPSPVRTGVSNFFNNLEDVWTVPAALLQGKLTAATTSFSRVLVNTTVGLVGVIDVGSKLGMTKYDEDFGQALGFWGVPSGPYLMVPFYGPLTVRDSAEPVAAFFWGPIDYIDGVGWSAGYYSLWAVNQRAPLLGTEELLDSQLDPYAYLRDGYLQLRWNKIHDGHPPYPLPLGEEEDDEEAFDPGPTEASAPMEAQ
ncbi:MlaA family lipoprotein [Chitinibacteraceae bacterium HSL-7]